VVFFKKESKIRVRFGLGHLGKNGSTIKCNFYMNENI